MADTLVSAETAAAAFLATHELYVNEAGADKKVTGAQIRQFVTQEGAGVASAATTTLGDGAFFHVTGTTTITAIAFATAFDGRAARVLFDGSLILTHSAGLILPGRANIQTQAGDTCTVVQDATGVVVCMQYERADGLQNVSPSNASVATQSPAAASTVYLVGSDVTIPANSLRVKTKITWAVTVAKTAAGTLALGFIAKVGTLGTIADASALTWTFVAGTAVADTGRVDLEMTIVGPLGSACVPRGHATLSHGLAATGLLIQPQQTVVAPTVVNINSLLATKIGLAIVVPASYVLTVHHVSVETVNL